MTIAEAIVIVTAMRQRCPVRPGTVPFELTADHRKALTLVLAAAGIEQCEPRSVAHVTIGDQGPPEALIPLSSLLAAPSDDDNQPDGRG